MRQFYVHSQKGEDLWAGTCPEPLEDGTNGPFRSINGALETIQKLNHQGRLDGAVVYLKGGDYELKDPLILRERHSANITFEPYPGETVAFSGAVKLKDFTVTTVNGKTAWKIHIPQVKAGMWQPRALYVNGQARKRSRFPKNGTLRITGTPGGLEARDLFDHTRVFDINPDDVKEIKTLVGSEIIVVHYWVDEHIPVTAYENGKVYSDRDSIFNLRDDFTDRFARFWIENVFEALSEDGEWYLNRTAGDLYYLPLEGESPENTLVELPVLSRLLVMDNVEGIGFRNITFKCTNWDYAPPAPDNSAHEHYGSRLFAASPQAAVFSDSALCLYGAKNVVFDHCEIRDIGNNALLIGPGSSHCRVVNSHIHDCGMTGVRIEGDDAYTKNGKVTAYNAVTGCKIHDCTQVFFSAIGIFIKDSFGNCLKGNEIYNLEYTGISCGWVWGYNESTTHHNIIEDNHIHHLGTGLMSDMGGIYLLGPQPGTELRGNLIHDVKKANYGGWGIYLDEGSSYVVVEKNKVYNTTCEAYFQHYGMENIIRDNDFSSASGEGVIGLGRIKNGCVAFNLIRNTLKAEKGTPVFHIGHIARAKAGFFVSEANGISYDRETPFFSARDGKETCGVEEWQSWGFDTTSNITAN
ncbi:MAG: right-handed parallel beta-helix repeat-containing protein [Treponema sp.]|nr:right-handed parallel beta-helix repeat-containing protein [Treponema sp.]